MSKQKQNFAVESEAEKRVPREPLGAQRAESRPKAASVRSKQHPKRGIVTSLKRFMTLRDEKIQKQVADTDDPHGRAEWCRELASRLADPEQVVKYIGQLNQWADWCEQEHWGRLQKCTLFWYGPDGLAWLATKKNMKPSDWMHYAEFMDEAALKALSVLIEQDLMQGFAHSLR